MTFVRPAVISLAATSDSRSDVSAVSVVFSVLCRSSARSIRGCVATRSTAGTVQAVWMLVKPVLTLVQR